MILRELFEKKIEKGGAVGIIFGRFNPPHKGHRAAWEMAAENPHWFVGTNKSTQGPKDPLPYEIKVEAMKAIWPNIEGHIIAETSWLTLASKVFKEYGDVTLNVYTDEDWVTKTLMQYNGQEGPHGYYRFDNINQQPTPRLSSATALRTAVQQDNREAFSDAAGVDADTLIGNTPFFDLVKQYLTPYAEKEKAKAVKKKKKEPEVAEGMFGLSPKEKGAIMHLTSKLSDIPNMWDHKAQTFTNLGKESLEKALNYNPKYIKYALNLTADDYEG